MCVHYVNCLSQSEINLFEISWNLHSGTINWSNSLINLGIFHFGKYVM